MIKIERGVIKNPKIDTIIKIANALRVSVDELIKGKKKVGNYEKNT